MIVLSVDIVLENIDFERSQTDYIYIFYGLNLWGLRKTKRGLCSSKLRKLRLLNLPLLKFDLKLRGKDRTEENLTD